MERLQIGVGPRLKPPLLLRNQNKKGNVMGLFDDLMKKFGGVDSNQQPTNRNPTQSAKAERKKTNQDETLPPIITTDETKKENPPTGKRKKGYTAPASDKTIVIEYLNFQGDLKQFIGDPKSIRRRGNHFSIRVAPTFKRISLNRSKTRILKGVPAPTELPREPLPVQTTTSNTSTIHYTNWQGEEKEFKIITGVVDDKGDFVRVRVSPTFQYITLKRTRIGNPEALFEKTDPEITQTDGETNTTQPITSEPTTPVIATGKVSIILTSCGVATYDATRIVREMRPDLGTFDTYNLLRDFPKTIAENVEPEKAASYKKQLEDAGCTVELK